MIPRAVIRVRPAAGGVLASAHFLAIGADFHDELPILHMTPARPLGSAEVLRASVATWCRAQGFEVVREPDDGTDADDLAREARGIQEAGE